MRGGVQDVAVKMLTHTGNDPRQRRAFEKVRASVSLLNRRRRLATSLVVPCFGLPLRWHKALQMHAYLVMTIHWSIGIVELVCPRKTGTEKLLASSLG